MVFPARSVCRGMGEGSVFSVFRSGWFAVVMKLSVVGMALIVLTVAMPAEGVGTMDNVIQHRGGSKFGRTQNSWPFVKLTIADDSIAMKTVLQEVVIKREWLQSIVLRRYVIIYKVIFRHNEPTLPELIEFWTYSPDSVLDSLRTKGYTVIDER
jgi:hypothetical protein